ncbi:MAG: hypothetical protein NTX64_16210 [Elusimicrobia bacterium]|nr:hypothetical protein [Elusimicrobiota bacterium]
MRVLREPEKLLSRAEAIAACEKAFRAVATRRWHPAHSESVELPGAWLRTVVSFDDEHGVLIRSEESGGHGWISIQRPAGEVVAMIPRAAIDRMRGWSVSALATRLLAEEEARTVGVVGVGAQGRLHVHAVMAVRKIKRILAAGRTPAQSQAFVADLARELGPGVAIEAADATRAAAFSDVLCVCTDAKEPVVFGNEVRRGCHINAVGSRGPDRRELDTNAILRSKVFLEDREMGFGLANDLRAPIEQGRVGPEAYATDLGDLLTGRRRGRTSSDDITLFKSVGHPAAEFYLALAAYQKALTSRTGSEV